ncbi:MAG: histidine phosphatase family protein [Anaerolineae bacterium]|nr:histidine phosphatase family protein [Anaerolineae bacterium]
MALLYLIRHPHTQINLDIPATSWDLSDQGHAQTQALLGAPFWPHVAAIYASREPKTITVAKEAALQHNLPALPRSAFGEVDRSAYVAPDNTTYEAAVAALFSDPFQHPFGWETAADALARFQKELTQVLAVHAEGDSIAIISHGLVLTLLMAHFRHVAPELSYWRSLGFATVAAVDRETLQPLTGFLPAPYADIPLP